MTPSSMTSAMRFSSVMPGDGEGRQVQRPGKRQLGIGQDRERQMQPLGGLALIIGVLGRQAEQVRHAQRFELGEMVAKAAGLRRAAARAGDVVPARRQIDARHAGARIDVKHGAAVQAAPD